LPCGKPWHTREGGIVPEPLLPPPDLAPPVPTRATPQQCIALWLDLLDACDQFLLAGLRREIGPDGDLKAAYRRWYARQMEEHDRMIFHMAAEFTRRLGRHAP
jgi:hypothetical protein